MKNIKISSIGINRGVKRVWLEGVMLLRAGFTPKTRYQVITKNGTMAGASTVF
jgi:hypothetical protein